MNFSFKDYYESYPHEDSLLRNIHKMDMHRQAEQDKLIHKRAISKGTFDAFGNNFLANDMMVKERFQELLNKSKKGERINPEEIRAVAALIKKDQEGHYDYLSRGDFNPDTGSPEWHQAWIDVYERWLAWLDNLQTNF